MKVNKKEIIVIIQLLLSPVVYFVERVGPALSSGGAASNLTDRPAQTSLITTFFTENLIYGLLIWAVASLYVLFCKRKNRGDLLTYLIISYLVLIIIPIV